MFKLSVIVLINQENVWLFFSIIPKKSPHSDVASSISFFTISKDICQSDILSRKSDIDSPVLSAIVFSGLNHRFMSCKRSHHVSFPADCICQNTSDIDCNLFAFHHAMFHNISRFFKTSSCATQNCNIVEVALVRSELSNGVFAHIAIISWNNFQPFSADHVSTSSSILKSCILLACSVAIFHIPSIHVATIVLAHHSAIIQSLFFSMLSRRDLFDFTKFSETFAMSDHIF